MIFFWFLCFASFSLTGKEKTCSLKKESSVISVSGEKNYLGFKKSSHIVTPDPKKVTSSWSFQEDDKKVQFEIEVDLQSNLETLFFDREDSVTKTFPKVQKLTGFSNAKGLAWQHERKIRKFLKAEKFLFVEQHQFARFKGEVQVGEEEQIDVEIRGVKKTLPFKVEMPAKDQVVVSGFFDLKAFDYAPMTFLGGAGKVSSRVFLFFDLFLECKA